MRARAWAPGVVALLVFGLTSGLAWGAGAGCDLTGRVSRVVDGDTLHLATSPQETVKIRLADIDAPERDQPHGRQATKLLSSLAYGKDLCATVLTTDRYGREVAHLYVDGRWLNRALVAQGAAWVYRKYAKPPYREALLAAETQARAGRVGLWARQGAVAPWEWRQR